MLKTELKTLLEEIANDVDKKPISYIYKKLWSLINRLTVAQTPKAEYSKKQSEKGKKRWAGTTKTERSKQASELAKKRWAKKTMEALANNNQITKHKKYE